MPGTEGGYYPFWSPDSRWIGFFTADRLRKIAAAGGPVQTICETSVGRAATWNRRNVILFSSVNNGREVHRVSAGGGISVAVTKRQGGKESSHYWPWFLPDGEHFLYVARANEITSGDLYVTSLDAPHRRKLLIRNSSNAVYSQGHILFAREGTLLAQPFDGAAQELRGDPFTVAERLGSVPLIGFADFSVSRNGVLTHASASGTSRRIFWLSRSGAVLHTYPGSGSYNQLTLSPNGSFIAFTSAVASTGLRDLWVMDAQRGTSTRVTFNAEMTTSPVWSPDGEELAFVQQATGLERVYRQRANLAGNPILIQSFTGSTAMRLSDWSLDGQFLLGSRFDSTRASSLVLLPVNGGTPVPLVSSKFGLGAARFSPDGKWIAYTSNETGSPNVFVQSYSPGQPLSGAKWIVSPGGGFEPRWNGNGKELFYVSPNSEVMSVKLEASASGFKAGVPIRLFETRVPVPDRSGRRYDVSRDGQRFLMTETTGDSGGSALNLITNWLERARK
jgi:eukaryotic-like serine/threonine-protein kinase